MPIRGFPRRFEFQLVDFRSSFYFGTSLPAWALSGQYGLERSDNAGFEFRRIVLNLLTEILFQAKCERFNALFNCGFCETAASLLRGT